MGVNKISLPTAYMIETLRSNSVSNQELLEQIEKKDVSVWADIHSPFDFNALVTLADEDKDFFRSVIEDGYQVKFVTINGLQRLLELKFGKLPDRDFTLNENGIDHLQMDEEQLLLLKQILSNNWIVSESLSDNVYNVKIELQ